MGKSTKTICLLIVFLLHINFITGCAVATIASMATMDSGYYTLKIPDVGKRPDILTIAEKVGNNLGYKVFGKGPNSITFQSKSSMMATMTVGSTTNYHITVSKSPEIVSDDPKMKKMSEELTIMAMAIGSYGKGGVSHAEQLANEFKDKLLEMIRQNP
jgi:hypothetical protein